MADYAIHDTTLIDTSNIIRKKEGSSALIDPADYPKRINLMGMLEEKTQASAPVCSFEDGADDVPSSSVKVTIPANLDGKSSVSEVQTGRNLFDYEAVEAFNANVIITRNDGDYTMQNNNSYGVGAFRGISFHLKPASYSLSLGEAITVPIRIYKNDAWFNNGINAGDTSCTFTVTEEADYTLSCTVPANSSLTIKKCQFEFGSTAHAYEPYTAPTQYTAELGRTIYGGQVDIVTGEGVDENDDPFTFTGQEVPTMLGYNAFWSDEGDTEVTYRSSGTITPVVPTLITKTITANDTYSAEDDDADGYSEVVVNVPSPTVTVTPLSTNRVYLYPDGISGTNVERTAQTLTATGTGKYVFASDTATRTNTSSNDGFVGVKKNGTFIVKQNLNTNVKVAYTIPDIDVVAGDEVSIVVGFVNYHTSCEFEIYTAIAFVEEVTS